MKVLFVSSGNSKWGISPIVKNQGDSLINKGLNIDFFTIKGKGVIGYLKHIRSLSKKLKTKNYDIIHAHYGLTGIVSYFAKRKEKLIISFMGADILYKEDRNRRKNLKAIWLTKLNKYLAKKSYDFIIIKSDEMASKLNNIELKAVLPNGVNFNTFFPIDMTLARAQLNLNKNDKIVLFASDPERREKNYGLIKQSIEIINDPLVKVICAYNKSQRELNLYYNAADVLVLSSHFEGSPNVIKEAMACNCPVVSTDVGDVRTIIGNTRGCYIAQSNPKDFASKIKMAICSGQRTDGRKNVSHMKSELIAERLIAIYKRLLTDKSKCAEFVG